MSYNRTTPLSRQGQAVVSVWRWRREIGSSDLSSTTRLVLFTLCNFMDVAGHCWPSIKRIANDAGLTEKSVCTHLKIAKAAGWIAARKGVGSRRSNQYDISLPIDRLAVLREGNRRNLEAHQNERQGVGALNGVQPNFPREHTIESSPDSHLGEEEFEHELWEIFPRNPASRRSAALSAFLALTPDDRANCILGAARYALRFESVRAGREEMEQRLRFVPSLTTWIAQRRWERR